MIDIIKLIGKERIELLQSWKTLLSAYASIILIRASDFAFAANANMQHIFDSDGHPKMVYAIEHVYLS